MYSIPYGNQDLTLEPYAYNLKSNTSINPNNVLKRMWHGLDDDERAKISNGNAIKKTDGDNKQTRDQKDLTVAKVTPILPTHAICHEPPSGHRSGRV